MINQFDVFYIVLLKPFISNLKCMEFQVDKKCIERVLIIRYQKKTVPFFLASYYIFFKYLMSRQNLENRRKIKINQSINQ